MRTNKITILVGLMAAVFYFSNLIAYAEGLDGKSFSGSSGMYGKKAKEEDVLKFENGRFISVDCAKYGFGSGSYVTRVEGDKTHFMADTYSDKTGRISWVGTVSGDTIDAIYLWYKKGKHSKPKQIKWFKGTVME